MSLTPDPADIFDAVGAVNSEPTVFIQSAQAPNLAVTAATVNRVAVPILPQGRIKMPKLQSGVNSVQFVTVGATAGADVALFEDGGPGQPLKQKTFGGGRTGVNPVIGFDINAS